MRAVVSRWAFKCNWLHQKQAEGEKAPTVSLVRSNMAFAGDFALVLALNLVPAIKPHYPTDYWSVSDGELRALSR
jgi:hypothetical protein